MNENKDLIVIKPKAYEDIDKIKENLNENIPSVVNLEETEEETAKKIAKYILDDLKTTAQVVRVAERVFCVTPLGYAVTQTQSEM